ncbi:uncharacterized protein LOC113788898 [Dermatophagoides pteronyssinus]|nr:uncharacterized protein LOC113788898 isoform X1 [Dermatophagoides pteronyssinus]
MNLCLLDINALSICIYVFPNIFVSYLFFNSITRQQQPKKNMNSLRNYILWLTIILFSLFIISTFGYIINQGTCAGIGEVCGGFRGVTCCNPDYFCDHSLGTGGHCNLESNSNLLTIG